MKTETNPAISKISSRQGWRCLFLAALALPASLAIAEESERQAEVSRRGAEVMPFSLAKTQHQFTPTPDGGIQRVVARDPKDSEQILLIQQHLTQLAEGFRRGDFSGPQHIHGAAMPGLAALRQAKPGSLRIAYQAEPAGATLTYQSDDPALVEAVHDWFKAQVHDHGHDAMMLHHSP